MVWDSASNLTLYNLARQIPTYQKQMLPPGNRQRDAIQCIDTNGSQIITCGQERELKIWDAHSGRFLKKYDVASFTQEQIISLCLVGHDGALYIGSKDSNIYQIDVQKGKLCIVYEGHWSRVTKIFCLPEKDTMVSVSDSNIKVWDLQYDETIKNMNEHTSHVVYCKLKHGRTIVSISQTREFKEWDYITGDEA